MSPSAAKKRGVEAIAKLDEAAKRVQKEKETELENKSGKKEDVSKEVENNYNIKTGENAEQYFKRIYKLTTKAQIYFEYLKFLKEMPQYENKEISNVINDVKENLQIDEIEKSISFVDLDFSCSDINNTPVLDALSAKLGYSLRFIAPPVKCCLLCTKPLVHKYPGRKSLVALFTLTGPKISSKLTLTCRKCPAGWKLDLDPNDDKADITYHPEKFGNAIRGFKFYPIDLQVKVVPGSRESYFEKNVCSGYWEEFSHGWLSAETKSEAYNMSFKDTENNASILRYFQMNPRQGGHFDKVNKSKKDEGEEDEDEDDDDDEDDDNSEMKVSRIYEVKRKSLSEALRLWLVQEELKDRKLLTDIKKGEVFGPKGEKEERTTFKESLKELMSRVDIWRREEIYPHLQCAEACMKRGCQR